MLSQGLSHVTFNANSTEIFDNTLKFYTGLGFKVISEKTESDQRSAWISLKSSCSDATDASIQLVQNVSAFSLGRPAGDIDWSLEGRSIAFSVSDVNVSHLFFSPPYFWQASLF